MPNDTGHRVISEELVARESGPESDFWAGRDMDQYTGGGFLSQRDVERLIDQRVVLKVTAVADPENGRFGVQRIVTFDLDGEEAQKSFGLVDKDGRQLYPGRALLLEHMAEHLARDGAPIPVRFVWAGNAFGLEPA